MKSKEEYRGIGSMQSKILFIGGAAFVIMGLLWLFSEANLSYSYGYYSRERDMSMAIANLGAMVLLGYGVWLLNMYFGSKKNQVCILTDSVRLQYRKLFSSKAARITAEIPFSQIVNVSEERRGVFGYVVVTCAGEQHKVAIENAGAVRDSIVQHIKK